MKPAIARSQPVDGARAAPLRPIRLMIVDDSLIARSVLARLIEAGEDLEIVASLPGARQAIEALQTETVDVILLDLEMPGMGGLEALPLIIKAARGARILVVSSHTAEGTEQTLSALALGAADTLNKPDRGQFKGAYPEALLGKIRALARHATAPKPILAKAGSAHPLRTAPMTRPGILAIGASTGGIHAMRLLLDALPPPIGIPILVTQHLPPQFMPVFARQLEMASGYHTVVAEDEMPLTPDQIIVAPGKAHLTICKQADRLQVRLDNSKSVSGFTPSVDPMFASVAEAFGRRALGVLLSGMGRDGVIGAERIVEVGGTIMAQDELSSSVWGMPRAAAEAGLASAILPPDEIAGKIAASLRA